MKIRYRHSFDYDAFLSHASEDKDFVQPLARELQSRGLRIWYDEFVLSVGNGLARSLDQGIMQSERGIVVLSHAYFRKAWTRSELGALLHRDVLEGDIILPIWHGLTRDEVLGYSALMADRRALDSSRLSIDQLAKALEQAIRRP